MLGSEHDDRMEAHDRVNRYYEIMGYDPPNCGEQEYQERFYYELERIDQGL